ncbi:hypothetical protein Glo7428_2547 [Gloeocapsa sp. PCC 7428]|nr:hypothetical protein Glo7428_2547 [Gloeocapsa sp. PCC 7428]
MTMYFNVELKVLIGQMLGVRRQFRVEVYLALEFDAFLLVQKYNRLLISAVLYQ